VNTTKQVITKKKKQRHGTCAYTYMEMKMIWNGLHEIPDQDLDICETAFSEWFSIEMAQQQILL